MDACSMSSRIVTGKVHMYCILRHPGLNATRSDRSRADKGRLHTVDQQPSHMHTLGPPGVSHCLLCSPSMRYTNIIDDPKSHFDLISAHLYPVPNKCGVDPPSPHLFRTRIAI